jgi:ABC-2 type transport system ATP-binding protein
LAAPHIETRNAWVEFPIFDAKARSLKKAFLGKAGGTIGRNESNVVVIEALRDITMSLELGDRVGLVGHNGAGKSTLLRLLSGIYEPTRGVATVTGRVAPIFDLGVGMDPEISGFENIIIRGLFLGQTRKQMVAKVDEIAEFTELGDYLSMPLRTYSTGMRVRLAMGVVTSIDPEILLLDEGIGAVDAEFLKKAQSLQRVPGAAVHDRDVDRPRHHQDDRRYRGGRARIRGRGRRAPCARGARRECP